MIASEQVSTHYDPSLPLRLACDASPVRLGAKTERPIAFASRKLTKTEEEYAQIDNNLGNQEVPCVFVWPIFHPVHRSTAVNIHLPSAQEHCSGYGSPASALYIILGWI